MADLAESRRTELVQLVSRRGFLRVTDASDELGVSEVTIRADLSELERRGSVTRVHGGAMLPENLRDRESSMENSLATAAAAKRDIGVRAARLVRDGESVFIDVGSTALALAEALVERRDLHELVVVTNGLSIALALEQASPRFTVVVTGGTLRPLQHSLVNPGASATLESLRLDLAFIGCNGVDAVNGVTNVNLPEAEVKRQVLRYSHRHILIADTSKLGQTELGFVGPLTSFEALVTAGDAPEGAITALETAGLRVDYSRMEHS